MPFEPTLPTGNMGMLFRRIELRVPDQRLAGIYQSVLDASALDVEYLSLLGLSALIALFGLLQNSAAVIIGAMLISPLMNPILSAALALLMGDGSLGRRTALVLISSILGAIGITWLIALLSPLKQLTAEILARTSPNLLDLFIAFLSGLAGTLALRGGPSSLTILPGVAIAVAVIPPLAVVGFGLSTRQWAVAAGAFLLFITNLVSIMLSAALIFRLMGFRPHREVEKGHWSLRYRMAISGGVLILLSLPLIQTLREAVVQVQVRSLITRELNSAFETDRSSVRDIAFSKATDGLLIHATVLTTRYFEIPKVHATEEALRQTFGRGTKLELDQVLVAQGGISAQEALRMSNSISGGVVRPVGVETPLDIKSSAERVVTELQKHVDEVLAGSSIRRIGGVQAAWGASASLLLNLQLASPGPVQTQTITLLASQLSNKSSAPVELHGSVELEGAAYNLALPAAKPRGRLGIESRRALTKLLQLAREQPALRLQVSCTLPEELKGGGRPPLLIRELESLLANSRLKPTQWNVRLVDEPSAPIKPALSAGATAHTGNAPQVACQLKAYQEF